MILPEGFARRQYHKILDLNILHPLPEGVAEAHIDKKKIKYLLYYISRSCMFVILTSSDVSMQKVIFTCFLWNFQEVRWSYNISNNSAVHEQCQYDVYFNKK